MHQVMNFMEEKIMPPLFKMASNKYLLAIRDAFTSTLAIVLIGSVFLLICYFPNESWAEFIGPYVPMLSVPNTLTLGLIALYMALSLIHIAIKDNKKNVFVTGIMANDATLTERLEQSGAQYTAVIPQQNSFLMDMLMWLVPIIIILGVGQLLDVYKRQIQTYWCNIDHRRCFRKYRRG